MLDYSMTFCILVHFISRLSSPFLPDQKTNADFQCDYSAVMISLSVSSLVLVREQT